MMTRFAWLALISLAVVLAGCKVTVHGPVRLAPSSLVGYSLLLSNSARSGALVSDQETYHFKSKLVAFDSTLDPARIWSEKRNDHDTMTVSLIFALPYSFNDAIITCILTFESHQNGSHDCKYEERTSSRFGNIITQVGLSQGTFRIEEIGQSA